MKMSVAEGGWTLLKILGRGGFGQVSLWHNPGTGVKIAIKKLHEDALKDETVKDKITERWCNEVDIMKKLSHANIVATLEVPAELNCHDGLPVLAMEYCSSGDLRQVLNKPKNCSGLPEFEILQILKDISSGLAYLHSCKVIHRDIKPENIVLQQKDSTVTYKLIDLGYAKALDQSSLSKSFVGTVQYIAPELFMGKVYTCSVDYWSFGLLTHEIITGYRPFLPGFSPSDWMRRIQNKARNVITVLENNNGNIVFSSSISRKNHLSRCFLQDIEKWLQLALDWKGQTRGRDSEKSKLVIFEELTKIICKKVVTVFSVPTYEKLSYEVTNETVVSGLRHWLREETGLEEDDQLLLLSSGKSLNMEGNLLSKLNLQEKNRGVIFLYSIGNTDMKVKKVKIPDFVEELRRNANKLLTPRQLKKSCADAVYFLQTQSELYSHLVEGIRVKIKNTKQKTLAIETLYEDLENEWTRIENYSQFLFLSHKIDLENYIHYRKTGNLKSSAFVRKWIQNVIMVNNKIAELKNSFDKSKQRQLVFLAKQRCKNLDDHSTNDARQRTPLESLVKKGEDLWSNVRNSSKTDHERLMSNLKAVELIDKFVEQTNKILSGENVNSVFKKISYADENLSKFLTHLTGIYKSTKIMKKMIENTQIERQREVWDLIGNAKPFYEIKPEKENSIEKENSPASDQKLKNPGSSESAFKKMSNSELLSLTDLVTSMSCSNLQDALSIINENNHLRYRVQEVQQKCSQMVKEMNSLDWDCILEL